ncbi:uncharacterized protein LOC132043422 [Lycium ferocissimum]|uniref:uncharacterized protein LOC132043422 n=1 Tax=Lycium ferocissimum TaxID=112874 RepID=UPI002814CB3D|nr:uncharacterized protein LOC132043422 [Lycium ferocissimum]
MTCNETIEQSTNDEQDYEEYDESMMPENLPQEIEQLENQEKPNLDETEIVNLGDDEIVKETRISIHLEAERKQELLELLKQYVDVFAWSYDDMPRLSTDIVSYRLLTDPTRPPIKQKPRKFNPDLSLTIKEEVTKQIKANVVRVTNYPSWLANIVPVPKKDGKIRICVDYRDLNKARYHQILMHEDDAEKTAFTTPWGVYCYRVMPFGLKNAARKGIELDPSKIKAIQDLPPPKSKKDVMSFLGRLNYISRFIAQSTVICEPIFKLLKKDAATKWTEECQKAFDRIKEYLSSPPVLVPPEPKAIKGQALADHLAENQVDNEYKPLTTYFPDEEVLFAGEDISEPYSGWRMFFDGASNFKGVRIGSFGFRDRSALPYLGKIDFPARTIWQNTKLASLGLGWQLL